jgi:hypothetical protein
MEASKSEASKSAQALLPHQTKPGKRPDTKNKRARRDGIDFEGFMAG